MQELKHLLKPITDNKPCGEKQNSSPLYIEIVNGRKRDNGQSFSPNGTDDAEQEEIDWKLIKENALELLENTHDLEIATTLCIALLHTNGFSGLTQGLRLIRQLLEHYWECCYPELEMDEPDNPSFARESRLLELGVGSFLKDVSNRTIFSHRMMGAFSLQAIKDAYREEPPENAPKVEHIEGTMIELGSDHLKKIKLEIKTGITEVNSIEEIFREKTASSNYPDLSKLASILKDVSKVLVRDTPDKEEEMAETKQVNGDTELKKTASKTSQTIANSNVGQINNRDDVVKAIENICKYYQIHEPSSPIPQLLERTKRLVNKEFIEILEDLSPDGVMQVRNILGMTQDN